MATLNPNIILAGRQPNVVNALAGGAQAANAVNSVRRQNALSDLYQEQGPGIMSGDQQALNALAQLSPQEAMGIQNSRQVMDVRGQENSRADERLQMARSAAARDAAAQAANLSAAEREQELAALDRGLAMATQAQGPEDFARAMQEVGLPQYADRWQDRKMLIAGALGVKDGFQMAQGGGDATLGSQEILEDGTIIQSTSAGPRVFAPTGEELTGPAAAQAIQEARALHVQNQRDINAARREGTLSADIGMGREAERVKAEGKMAPEIAREFMGQAATVRSSLGNMSDAIRAIDEGAQSGVIYNMMPSVTTASASLDNAMQRLGLDVIGSVTFGALSEGEMRLAMDTAVPQNLNPERLREWLVRKREAQTKALEALNEAALWFAGGGTMEEWLERKQGNGAGETQSRPSQPAPSAMTPQRQGQPVQAPTAPQQAPQGQPAPQQAPAMAMPDVSAMTYDDISGYIEKNPQMNEATRKALAARVRQLMGEP